MESRSLESGLQDPQSALMGTKLWLAGFVNVQKVKRPHSDAHIAMQKQTPSTELLLKVPFLDGKRFNGVAT